jgi:hypothetical protein
MTAQAKLVGAQQASLYCWRFAEFWQGNGEKLSLAKDLPAGCESREYDHERDPARGAERYPIGVNDVAQGKMYLLKEQPRYLLRKTRPQLLLVARQEAAKISTVADF